MSAAAAATTELSVESHSVAVAKAGRQGHIRCNDGSEKQIPKSLSYLAAAEASEQHQGIQVYQCCQRGCSGSRTDRARHRMGLQQLYLGSMTVVETWGRVRGGRRGGGSG